MISAWWLVLIIPASFMGGFIFYPIFAIGKEDRDYE